nr:MAG TPA: hypothetical protein [Caudoviricetes sp.]
MNKFASTLSPPSRRLQLMRLLYIVNLRKSIVFVIFL